MTIMVSIGKRAGGATAAVLAALAIAGPATADAATIPAMPAPAVTPVSGAFQAGIDAALGGWAAGAEAAAGGFNAGAAALGLPFQFEVQTGLFGVPHVGLASLQATP
jgi:hypothetical protein